MIFTIWTSIQRALYLGCQSNMSKVSLHGRSVLLSLLELIWSRWTYSCFTVTIPVFSLFYTTRTKPALFHASVNGFILFRTSLHSPKNEQIKKSMKNNLDQTVMSIEVKTNINFFIHNMRHYHTDSHEITYIALTTYRIKSLSLFGSTLEFNRPLTKTFLEKALSSFSISSSIFGQFHPLYSPDNFDVSSFYSPLSNRLF